ncbi:MAG: STAS domain-containing protein [Leptospiraceae bacterium]|nr:STAS domain-containing protein [Leptospiraceae bacterium]
MSDITIQKAEKGSVSVLVVSGKLDAKTAPQLSNELQSLLAGGHKKIVCEMKGVSYIASAGVGTLKAALVEARKGGGDVRLAALTNEVQDVFDVLGFSKLFTISGDLNTALADF